MTRSGPVAVYTDVGELDPTPGVQRLEKAGFTVRILNTSDPDEIATDGADAEVLLVEYTGLGAELMDKLPQLRLICTQSAGVDTVDLTAARERGIWVANVAAAATDEVASHALAMALAMTRCLPQLDRDVRTGVWDGTRHLLRTPAAMTLGLIGMGRIGRTLAHRAAALFGTVLGHDPSPERHSWPASVEAVDLHQLLARSEVVSLHLPLTPHTHHLIAHDELALMPADGIVVNVSRGDLIDLEALLAALDSGHLAGAALDVLPQEPPPPDLPALRHPRLLVTPHAGYLSPAAASSYVLLQAENAVAWHRDGRPIHTVVQGRHRS